MGRCGRPVRKCSLEDCSFCIIFVNCGQCKTCLNTKLKAKCLIRYVFLNFIRTFLYLSCFLYRQCPRLNKRHCPTTRLLDVVSSILRDVVNNVFIRIVEEKDAAEKEDVEQEVEGNIREPWTCPVCSSQVMHRQNIARHQSLNCSAVKVPKAKPIQITKPTSYKCEICDVVYRSKTSLTAHMKRLHMEFYCQVNRHSLFQCRICDFKCTASRFLKGHIQRFHTEKGSMACKYCEKRYSTEDSLRVHVKKAHANYMRHKFVCLVCGRVLSCQTDYQNHFCDSYHSESQTIQPNTEPELSDQTKETSEISSSGSHLGSAQHSVSHHPMDGNQPPCGFNGK